MQIRSIGIIGAGISGLMAGLVLRRAGHEVTVFEARNRTGGRIQTLTLGDMLVETGPEFIHGHLRQTLLLLKYYGIDYEEVKGIMYQSVNGKILEAHDFFEGWNVMLKKMKGLKRDLSFSDFLNRYFSEECHSRLKQQAIRYAEGFDLANVHEVSTMYLSEEWQHEESEQYRITEGYGALIRAMENEFRTLGGTILLEHPVQTLNWKCHDPEIKLRDGRSFSKNKWILSLPINTLNHLVPPDESFTFRPSDTEKELAFEKIGFGSVVKVVLIWDQLFWARVAPKAQFIFSDQFIPTWWTSYPKIQPMITGWLGGTTALKSADKPDEFFLEKAIASLAGIFPVTKAWLLEHLRHYRVFNWNNIPWSRGGYSYSKPGFRKAKINLRKSLDDCVYFSGEACYDGSFPGTVEAALISGQHSATHVLKDIIEEGNV